MDLEYESDLYSTKDMFRIRVSRLYILIVSLILLYTFESHPTFSSFLLQKFVGLYSHKSAVL